MQDEKPMPHLIDQAPAMQPIGRNVAQWAEYFADRSIADLIASLQAYNRLQCGVDSQTDRDQYDWYHTLRNMIVTELVYRLGPDVWNWSGRIETPDARAVNI